MGAVMEIRNLRFNEPHWSEWSAEHIKTLIKYPAKNAQDYDIKPVGEENFMLVFETAQKYGFNFIDKYDQIKLLTKLEREIFNV